MMNLVLAFARDEAGEDMIEYGLLGSFIAAVALATLISDPLGIRGSVVGAYRKAVEALVMAAQGDIGRL